MTQRRDGAKKKPAAADAPKEDAPAKTEDVALVHGRTEDGEGLRVIRKKGDELSAGEVRPLKDGQPIHGEVLSLKPRPEMPLLCDVEVTHAAPTKSHAGPAR
ncbi:MAG: hypothetical protein AAGH15_21100, partial [Myxococcota bacterium]